MEEATKQGTKFIEIYSKILTPAQGKLGDLWHEGKINVAQEHLGTQITLNEMGKLQRLFRPRAKLGLGAVVAAVEDEYHSLGAQMVADLFYLHGWTVNFLGGNTPSHDLVEFVRKNQPALVALSITLPELIENVKATIKVLKNLPKAPKIMIGGIGLKELQTVEKIGADIVIKNIDNLIKEANVLLNIERKPISLEDYLKNTGQHIQFLRKAKKKSQQEIAIASSLDRTYISAVEHGKQNVTIGALHKLSSALEIPLDRFLDQINRGIDGLL